MGKKEIENNWIKLSDVIINDNINQVHCDTRDFYCLLDTEKTQNSEAKKLLRTKKIDENCLIDSNDIVPFLKVLDNNSREGLDDVSWRFLTFNGVMDGAWIKYIRFYRHEKLNKFIIMSNDKLLDLRLLTPKNIDKELLAAQ